MKKIILAAGLLLTALSGSEAQIVKTPFNGGGLNVIPKNFSSSGQTRLYTYSLSDEQQVSKSFAVTVYGNDFNTIEKEFSLNRPMPFARKAEYSSISLDDFSVRLSKKIRNKTCPYFLQYEIYVDSLNDYVTMDFSSVDNLLAAWNNTHDQKYQSINTPEIFADILSLFTSYWGRDEEFIGFIDNEGKICCYVDRYNYGAYQYFYDYKNNGYKYPLDFYTIENDVVYHIEQDYKFYAFLPDNLSLNWIQSEYDIREKDGYGFMWYFQYSNFDELSYYGGEVFGGSESPFLTQNLFNNDDKYEYISYRYEVGDWKTFMEAEEDDNIYVEWREFGINSYFSLNNESYEIANLDSIVDLYGITTTFYNDGKFYFYRNQLFRSVENVGFCVLSDDGNLIFNFDKSPNSDEGVYVDVFTYNNRNYMYITEVDGVKEEYNYFIYEIMPNNTSVQVIKRMNQPFASAKDGIIDMQLDNSHTDSNAELINMAGQSVGSRYIPKGETRPRMNAAGLPDGIYNLILNRNGETIGTQKMLIK